MAAGCYADPFASFRVRFDHCRDVQQLNKMRRALNSPLSPHSVGLITTSFSLLQPLRKRRTLRKQNALAKNMAFLNCNSVTDSASPSVWDLLLWLPASEATSTRCFSRDCSGRAAPLPISGPFLDPVFIRGARTTEAFQKKVYLGEKTLTELSYFHVFYFWSQSFYFFLTW